MDYKDPIQVAKELLEQKSDPMAEDFDVDELLEEIDLEEAKAKKEDYDEDDKEDDKEDDEEEVEEGKMPPWLDKKKKKDDDGDDEEDDVKEAKSVKEDDEEEDEDEDDEEVNEAEVILDVEDNQDTEGKKATKTAKGKGKQPEPKMKPSKASAKQDKQKVKEYVSAMFAGEDLSEDFQSKATTIFEAAVNEQVSAIEEDLRNQYEEILEDNIKEVNEEMASKLDDYLNYVVEEWMKENELAVDTGIRTEVSESFMDGLKGLFEDHYIDVPEQRYDILESSLEKIVEIQTELNDQIEKNIELKKEMLESNCENTFNDVCEDLVDTEIERLRSLAEGVEFETEEQYREKLNVIKESYFDKTNPTSSNFDTEMLTEETENNSENAEGAMGAYVNSLSKHSKYNKL